MMDCFGDSLTFGFGLKPGYKWIDILVDSGYDIVNYGVNGAVISEIQRQVMVHVPRDKVFIMGGTNDFVLGGSIDYVLLKYLEINEYLKDKCSKVFLGIPTPTNPDLWEYKSLSNKLEAFQKKLLSTFPRNRLVDFYQAFTPYDSSLFFDEIHPNKKGAQKMAQVFLKETRL